MRKIWVPQLTISLMLLWALNPGNPYGYYILLRLVCCTAFVYLALQAFNQEKQGWVWVLAITAVIYNPIIRIHLTREIWLVINVITIGIAVASVFALKTSQDKSEPPDKKSSKKEDSVMITRESGRPDMIPGKKEGMNKLADDGRPLIYETIHDAVEKGDLADMKRHLARGAAVNARNKDGNTPLHWATFSGQTEAAELLIKYGAEVNVRDKNGRTPLHWAARSGDTEIAEMLLNHGAGVNARDEYGWTPLGVAAALGCTKTAEVLIKYGAEVNAEDKGGRTPLHWAAGLGYTETADLLQWHGGGNDEFSKNSESYVRLWAKRREKEVRRSNVLSVENFFAVTMYSLSAFGQKDLKINVPSEPGERETDISEHYSGDATLFELGCYLYCRIDFWLFKKKPYLRELISPIFAKEFNRLFTKALGINHVPKLFEQRISWYCNVLARKGADVEEYYFYLTQLILLTRDNRTPEIYDFDKAPLILNFLQKVELTISLTSWERAMVPGIYESWEIYCKEIDTCKQAVHLKPNDPQAHYNLGVIYSTLDRYQEAIDAFKQAFHLKPDFADAHYNLGRSYLMLKNTGLALEEYKILKSLDPGLAETFFNAIYR